MRRSGTHQLPVELSTIPKRVSHIQFGLADAEEIQRMSELQVCSRELFRMPQRNPAPNGCLDPRLGVSDKHSECKTCNMKLTDCAGHYGYIQLELPVFHIGYYKHTLTVLQCVCKSCARVMLPEDLAVGFRKRLRSPRSDALTKTAQYKKVVEKCKKTNKCPHCGAHNGTVKKVTSDPHFGFN
jgi:DNA-directed RNA polymerase III subunit RPC1